MDDLNQGRVTISGAEGENRSLDRHRAERK